MKRASTLAFMLLNLAYLAAQSVYGEQPLAHTYSLVAYDSLTGNMGVAVQSHWFSVGTAVIWGEAGVGVVATQSFTNPAFGPDGLALLKKGRTAQEAVNELISADEGRDFRQLGIVDSKGNAASYTGAKCIDAAGYQLGGGYATQANMMENDRVWSAMAKAFEAARGQDLAERLVAALEAAQSAGGDIRGRQSAALLVVSAQNTGKPWVDRIVDLRVEDHPTPVIELKRLLKTHKAYSYMNQGDLQLEAGDVEAAMQSYGAAGKLFPENLEMKFWTAVNLANSGKVSASLPLFADIFKKDKNWAELLKRLPKSGLLTVSEADKQRILETQK